MQAASPATSCDWVSHAFAGAVSGTLREGNAISLRKYMTLKTRTTATRARKVRTPECAGINICAVQQQDPVRCGEVKDGRIERSDDYRCGGIENADLKRFASGVELIMVRVAQVG